MSFVIPALAIPSVPVQGSDASFAVGRNYVEHAIEMGHTGREAPFFFMKPGDAVLPIAEGTVGKMHYPTLSKSLHHELELVVAIGKGGRDITAAKALEHIWGYGVGLDMTRRDLQAEAKKLGRPWCMSKGFDESAPIGPLKAAADCKIDANSVISLEVNGTIRQKSTLGKLIWSVAEVIEHISKAWELQPGDLIFSGTPEGVAAVEIGDTLKGSVEGVGTLEVQIVAG
jgi:fumarylpyruvate hydrolase